MKSRVVGFLAVAFLACLAVSCRGDHGKAVSSVSATPTSALEPTDQMEGVEGVALGSRGEIYATDWSGCRIWRVDETPPAILAGGRGLCRPPKDGAVAMSSDVFSPSGVVAMAPGDVVFSSGCGLYQVATDVISAVPGTGSCEAATTGGNGFYGVATDRQGSIYFSVWAPECVVNKLSGGVVSILAGTGSCGRTFTDGPADQTPLSPISGIAVDEDGDVFLTDPSSCRVLEVSNGEISSIAGVGRCGFGGDGGMASAATLNRPSGIAVDPSGKRIYVSDTDNHRIRVIEGGNISTFAGTGTGGVSGSGGPPLLADLSGPRGIALSANGDLFVADFGSCRVLKISAGQLTVVAASARCTL